jgi:hypothetical protein
MRNELNVLRPVGFICDRVMSACPFPENQFLIQSCRVDNAETATFLKLVIEYPTLSLYRSPTIFLTETSSTDVHTRTDLHLRT